MHTRRRGSSGSDKPATDENPEGATSTPRTSSPASSSSGAGPGPTPASSDSSSVTRGVKGVPVPDVKLATGKLTDILEAHDADSEFPEDLPQPDGPGRPPAAREHGMAENGQDHQNKRSLQNTESKIRRLANYYRGDGSTRSSRTPTSSPPSSSKTSSDSDGNGSDE